MEISRKIILCLIAYLSFCCQGYSDVAKHEITEDPKEEWVKILPLLLDNLKLIKLDKAIIEQSKQITKEATWRFDKESKTYKYRSITLWLKRGLIDKVQYQFSFNENLHLHVVFYYSVEDNIYKLSDKKTWMLRAF